MKKIMIALAAVAMAMVVQAATVSWSTVAMYDDKGAKVANTANVYVYLLENADAYDKLTNIWGAYGSDIKAGGDNADGFKTTGQYTHKATNIYAPETASPNTTYYAAIIATIGSGDNMKYYAEKAAVTTGDDGAGSFTMGGGKLDTAANAAGAWQSAAAPEPTSGMLLLMGLAGLALRRRRA